MLTSRNTEFSGGMYGTFQTGIAPTSTLIPYMRSPIATNTSSRTDAGRATITGQLLPSQNAYAPDTYSKIFTGTPTRVGY
jgi:hypothetical protein